MYNIKDEKLKPYKVIVVELIDKFYRYNIHNILRTKNRYVDVMASVASLAPIEIEDEETILTNRNLGIPSYLDHIQQVQVFHLDLKDDFE